MNDAAIVAAVTAFNRDQRRLVLALLCAASFGSAFNNLIITPILPEVTKEMGVSVSVGGLLVTSYAIAGTLTSVVAGPVIDRLGRKPLVLAGMCILTLATLCSAVAPNFELLLAARAIAGLGVACLTPAVFSAVGDYFDYEERGRAMSWVISINQSASILGVPAGAIIAGLSNWRMTFVLLTGICAALCLLLFAKLPADPPAKHATGRSAFSPFGTVLSDGPTVMAIVAGLVANSYWFVMGTYMAAYFSDEFGIASWALGALTMTSGIGLLVGASIGGRLADERGKRPVILVSLVGVGVFTFLATTAATNAWLALICLLLFSTAAGARFASAQAVMTEMLPEYRGTVMALNASAQQLSIVTGSSLGGVAISAWGYIALGPLAAGFAAAAFVCYYLFTREVQPATAPATQQRARAA